MTNIATLLKSEITRLARKEIRAEIASLKKASASYRIEIAALKRQLKEVERALRQATKANASSRAPRPATNETASRDTKFSARGLKAHREKLGFSAKDYGLLVGASSLSIYRWEDEKGAPRAKFLPALAAVRQLGKREALKRLSTLTERSPT